VAAEGFERLRTTMVRQMKHGKSARERLVLCGSGYVEFALRWPRHFLVMFDLAAVVSAGDDTARIGESAFRVLLEAVTAAQQEGVLAAGDPMNHAWTAWSLVHGIAKLAIGRNLPLSQRATLDFTKMAAEAIISGMKGSPSQTPAHR
jgi:AcrR family transcriptional regulator